VTEDVPALSPETRALLDREREIPPLSPAVRARTLAAARAAIATGAIPAPAGAPAAWSRWAVAASLTCVAAAAAATVAYRHHQPERHGATAPAIPSARERPAPAIEPTPPVTPAPLAAASPSAAAIPSAQLPRHVADDGPRRARTVVTREELRLLRQARGAVARDDFAAALPPIAEHARDFPNGRLAEEREALHVKALVGLGRSDEARRAAASFAARFPRSVLLPAIRGMSTGSE